MSSETVKRQIAKEEKKSAELEAERTAIVDRIKYLRSHAKSLAFPAHHEGDAGAKAELKATNADIQRLQPALEAKGRLIGKTEDKLQALEVDLRQAEANELTAERDQLEKQTLGKWLEAQELRGQSESAKVEFEGLRDRVEGLNARLRQMGRHAPGFTVIHGSDERKRAEVESRLRELRSKVTA